MAIVAKFGGHSGRDGATLEHVINNIILQDSRRRVLTFSAPGYRFDDDIKVTDLLIQIGDSYLKSKQYATDIVDNVKERFYEIADHLGIERSFLNPYFQSLEDTVKGKAGNNWLWNKAVSAYRSARDSIMYGVRKEVRRAKYLDAVMRFGELIQCEIAAEALRKKGVNAKVYYPEEIGLVTDSNFGKAKLKSSSYKRIAEKLKPVLEKTDEIIIIPGFCGVDKHGSFTTLGREGTDFTGAILANAVDAKEYENWGITDGVMRADPRIVENPEMIRDLTFTQARELAYSGANVLHPDTLAPLVKKNIPLHVRNTFDPQRIGTYIRATKEPDVNIVDGVACKKGFAVFYLQKMGANEEIGYLNRLTGIFAKRGVSIDQMTTSIDSIAIAVANNAMNIDIGALKHAIIKAGLVDGPDAINAEYDKAMVCVVGEGMRHTPGVLEKLSGALSSNGINIETVYHGPSQGNVIFGIAQKDAERAVRAIYNACFGKPAK